MVGNRLSIYECGLMQKVFDNAQQGNGAAGRELRKLLQMAGLPLYASRFEIAQYTKEVEREWVA